MSASTNEARRSKHPAPPATNEAAPVPQENGHDTAAAVQVVAATPAVEQEHDTEIAKIDGQNVGLVNQFRPGHMLTANQAKILFTAYVRQFTNNENANAEARRKRLAAAKNDAERLANQPLTPAELSIRFLTYEPSVGSTPRQSAVEKLRFDTTWSFWMNTIAEHNKQVAAGQPGIITKALGKPATFKTKPRLEKNGDKAAHALAVAAYEEWQANQVARLQAHPEYGPQVEGLVAAKLAEIEAAKAAEKAAGKAAEGPAAAETVAVEL